MKDYASGSNHITNLQRLILVLTKGNPKDTNERIILILSANLRFVKPPPTKTVSPLGFLEDYVLMIGVVSIGPKGYIVLQHLPSVTKRPRERSKFCVRLI